jgi:hypothetical protein
MDQELVKYKNDLKISKKSKDDMVNKKAKSFRLTDRDFEIFAFLLEQKFASLEQIYFRFFDARVKVTDPMPAGLHVTRQRLQILKRNGFIKSEKVYSEARSLYLLTGLGVTALRAKKPHLADLKVINQIDFRNYDHDTKVNDCRIAIERTGKIIRWLPERKLRAQGFESDFSWDELPSELVPDGIFITSKGERVAFEIETTPRKKSRYEEKLLGFRSVMLGSKPLIHRVIWVGYTDRVYGDLKDVASGTDGFMVESYSHFLSKLWPRGMPEKV